jgi:hypothetical protein
MVMCMVMFRVCSPTVINLHRELPASLGGHVAYTCAVPVQAIAQLFGQHQHGLVLYSIEGLNKKQNKKNEEERRTTKGGGKEDAVVGIRHTHKRAHKCTSVPSSCHPHAHQEQHQ